MIGGSWVEPRNLLLYFEATESMMHRYPAVDPPSFRRAVEEVARRFS